VDAFWSAFWPNFASTILGIVFGVPIGLALNRYALFIGEKRSRIREGERLRIALQSVGAALEFNRGRLSLFLRALRNDAVRLDPALDVSTWDVVKEQIVPLLDDPELPRRLAYHFDRLASLARLNALYLDAVVGMASTLSSASQTRGLLQENLISLADGLTAETVTLVDEVKKAEGRGRHGRPNPPLQPTGAAVDVSARG
jgi:hypothetical protein